MKRLFTLAVISCITVTLQRPALAQESLAHETTQPSGFAQSRPDIKALTRTIRSEYQRLVQAGEYDPDTFRAWVQPQIDQLDLSALSTVEIETLCYARYWFKADDIRNRLRVLATGEGGGEDEDTARALALLSCLAFQSREDFKPLAIEAIAHPGFAAALADHLPPGSSPRPDYSAAWEVLVFMPSFDEPQFQAAWQCLAEVQASLAARTDVDNTLHVRRLLFKSKMAAARLPLKLRLRFAEPALSMTARAIEVETDEAKRNALQLKHKSIRLYMTQQSLLGKPVADVEFIWSTLDGSPASIADLRGSIVLISFWATSCGACQLEYPALREIAAKYAGQRVVVLGLTSVGDVSGDALAEQAKINQAYTKEHAFSWPIAFSSQSVFDERLGVFALPHLAIVDDRGILRANGIEHSYKRGGLADLAAVEQIIDQLIVERNQ